MSAPEPSLERLGPAQAVVRMMRLRAGMRKSEAQGLVEEASAKGIAPSMRWQLIVVSPEPGLYTIQEKY